jgi:hypothetical protein
MRPDHLTESELSGYLDDDLSAAEIQRVRLHVESCPECREALVDVMRAVDSFEPGTDTVPTPARVRTFRRRWSWLGVAAVAASIAVLMIQSRDNARLPGREVPMQRSGATGGRKVIPVLSPTENAIVPSAGLSFLWRGNGSSADLYHLTLLNESGEPLWQFETRDTAAVLPARITLQSKTPYFWRVDGIANGIVATSGAHRFLIR